MRTPSATTGHSPTRPTSWTTLGIPSPVPPDRTVEALRALLTADPPKRWHFFKRSRAKAYEPAAAAFLAFHGAHGHDRRPGAADAVHDVSQLWARIHR